MTSQPRPVWLDDDLCGCIYNALAQAYSNQIEKADEFHAAWKAAPGDAAEAIAAWFGDHFTGLDEYDRTHLDEIAASLLDALGYRHTEQASDQPHWINPETSTPWPDHTEQA